VGLGDLDFERYEEDRMRYERMGKRSKRGGGWVGTKVEEVRPNSRNRLCAPCSQILRFSDSRRDSLWSSIRIWTCYKAGDLPNL
jgi:hypothetical protein